MTIKVAVPAESVPGERRVAVVPDGVRKLVSAGLAVQVEAGAGMSSYITDLAYEEAGATMAGDRRALFGEAAAVVKVQAPEEAQIAQIPSAGVVISFLQPATQGDLVRSLARQGVTAFSLELVPRISRAQSMDALSSQAGVSGYRAVTIAATKLPKFFPMLMTAAGTIAPARVLVLGAGVAGLQAIATSRRLGAVVEAYDVRPAVKEEVQSLGARFLELELDVSQAEGAGGYAGEQSEDFLARQRVLIGTAVADSDVVITTAAVPGRAAPLLVTAEMVGAMRPGSVIVDLAAESGGNCEVSRVGEDVLVGQVTVHGASNLPSQMPVHASQLFSRNVTSLLLLLVKDGEIRIDMENQIVRDCCVTHGGEIVNARAREMVEAATS